jgi:hypothetical protein
MPYRVSLALALAMSISTFVAGPLAQVSAASTLDPTNPTWVAYYTNPTNTSIWSGFCGAGGASYRADANGVPACGPTGSSDIYVPGGPGPNWTPLAGKIVGFQCMELAERYLYVKYGFAGLNNTNGGPLVSRYAAAHHLSPVVNGSGKLPAVGDVMSFSTDAKFDIAGGDGHVGIVTDVSVNPSGTGHITIVGENQNFVSRTNHALTAGSATMQVRRKTITSFDASRYIEWLHVAGRLTDTVTPDGRVGTLQFGVSTGANVRAEVGNPQATDQGSWEQAGVPWRALGYDCSKAQRTRRIKFGVKGPYCLTAYYLDLNTNTLGGFDSFSARYEAAHGSRIGMSTAEARKLEGRPVITGHCLPNFMDLSIGHPGAYEVLFVSSPQPTGKVIELASDGGVGVLAC